MVCRMHHQDTFLLKTRIDQEVACASPVPRRRRPAFYVFLLSRNNSTRSTIVSSKFSPQGADFFLASPTPRHAADAKNTKTAPFHSRSIAGSIGLSILKSEVPSALKRATKYYPPPRFQSFDPQDLEEAIGELNIDDKDTGDEGWAVTAVALSPSGDELAVGTKNGDVKLYELPSLAFKSMLTRFTAPVLGLDYGMKDGGVM